MRSVANLWAGYNVVVDDARRRIERDLPYLFEYPYGKVSEVVWRRIDRTFTLEFRLLCPEYLGDRRVSFTVSAKSVREVRSKFFALWPEWARNNAFASSLIATKRAQELRASVAKVIADAEGWDRRAEALSKFAVPPTGA